MRDSLVIWAVCIACFGLGCGGSTNGNSDGGSDGDVDSAVDGGLDGGGSDSGLDAASTDGGADDAGDLDAGPDASGPQFSVSGVISATAMDEKGFSSGPFEGATVSVMGTALSAVTDAEGAFLIEGVPSGTRFVSVSASGYWSLIEVIALEADSDEFNVELVADELVAFVVTQLKRNVATIEANAIVTTRFDFGDGEGARGGESAVLNADSDDPFITAEGFPEVDALPEGVGEGLVFTGVDPGDSPVTVTFSGAPGLNDCVSELPGVALPIAAKTITEARAVCTDL